MVHNNVHTAFHHNFMFLSCGNNLIIVHDPSGDWVWSVCVKTCSCFMMLVCERVNLMIFMVLCSPFYYSYYYFVIYVTESLIVLLLIIKLYRMSLLSKYFNFKKITVIYKK